MTTDEFISLMKSNGAWLAPGVDDRQIALTNSTLQNLRAATLPMFMIDLYKKTGGLVLGNGYIFGPAELALAAQYPVPSITQINNEIATIASMRGKTVFGQNDLFWFAFDAFGTCYMLDNLTLQPMRQYTDPYRSLVDCLIAGK